MSVKVEYKNIHQFCRICFELKADLVSCFTGLFIEDVSCTIHEILKLLIQEEDDSNFPEGICQDCKELATATFILKVKYTKTTEALKKSFNTAETENKDVQLISDTVDSYENLYVENTDGENDLTDEIEIHNEDIKLKNECPEPSPQTYENVSQGRKSIFLCPICPEQFQIPSRLRAHAHTHKTLRKYFKGKPVPKNAVFVAKSFKEELIFNEKHILHPCVTCRKNLSVDTFFSHMKMHREQVNVTCKKCGRIFRKASHLSIHKVRAHLEEYPFRCQKCKKGFVIKRNYDCHLLTHTEKELPHKCNYCSKSFSNPNHLHRHLFIHTENVSYGVKYKVHRCNFCKNSFKTLEELLQHRAECDSRTTSCRRRVAPDEPRNFQCQLCTKKYHSIEGLDLHTRTKHKDEKHSKILCSVCGKSFVNIFVHMASHNDLKPYKCELCPKTFTTKTVLKQHLLVHSGKKPFICSSCGKAFNNYYNLQVHERIHKGDKCHKCEVCGKGFLEKSYLSKHMRIHKIGSS